MGTQLNLPHLSRENSCCDQPPIAGGIDEDLIPLFVDSLSLKTTEEYAELGQVARAYQETPEMMQAVRVVDKFVRENPIQLHQSYDYHHFHHELTVITKEVKTCADLKGIWGTFLNRLEGRTIYQPNGNAITLHTGMERDRLAGRKIEVTTNCLSPKSSQFDRECEQIFGIAQECFAEDISSCRNACRESWRCPRNEIHMAKRRDTGEVLGYVWTEKKTDEQGHKYLYIRNVARKAEACSIGVAKHLFQRVFAQSLNHFRSVYLEVRESNQDAIALYSKWGFRKQEVHTNYFMYPLENAHVMVRSPVVTQ